MAERFLAPRAWVDGAWARDVLLCVDEQGCWSAVRCGATAHEQRGAQVLAGPVVPALVNAHSHAFQRAIVGLTERPGSDPHDDFWSWRDRMYAAARRITPAQLEAIAAQLYAELLVGGYTQVCEFHYLHHAADGSPPADPVDMSLALVRAARRVGIGLTLLPVLYMRSGFGASALRDDQRRFACDPAGVVALSESVRRQCATVPDLNLGVAIHSLRAAAPAAMTELADWAARRGLPVHLHIAEQPQEVRDCLAHTGQRPVEWLLQQAAVDSRWNLVHATHASAVELQALRATGASVVLCPGTEANLGDGVFDWPAYGALGGSWSVGSDSHVLRSWPQELALLEYGQRLLRGQRNVMSQPGRGTAAVLLQGALAGGAAATGLLVGGLAPGCRADFLVLDPDSPALLGLPEDHVLDGLIFSAPHATVQEVWVGARRRVADGRVCGPDQQAGLSASLARGFREAMQGLWG